MTPEEIGPSPAPADMDAVFEENHRRALAELAEMQRSGGEAELTDAVYRLAATVALARPAPAPCSDCGRAPAFLRGLCQECYDRREAALEEVRRAGEVEAIVAGLIPARYRAARADNPEVLGWFAEPEGEALLLSGRVGVGKTWQMYGVGRALAETGRPGPYRRASVVRLLSELRPGGGRETLDDLIGAGVLLLDDLGAEKPSVWVEERLYELVNERYEAMATTVITTNLPPRGLAEVVGDRIASRLAEWCRVVVLTGPDRRRSDPEARR